jgi:Protein of unknown function (DUF3048) N-terminal domain/Protein of unknown function (DUF3048) C-terminal domain
VKRKFFTSSIVTVVVLALSGCASISSAVNGVLNKKSGPVHSFTGLPGKDGPILAVKIDDTNPAHPQVGISSADVVYVEQVEAGLTRLLAIFSSQIPEKIGPIRSVRISDIDLLAQYGKVGFAYSGAQSKMRPVVAAANLVDLGAERNSPEIYTRDENRVAPTNMILLPKPLLAKALSKDPSAIASSRNMGWTFGDAPEGGQAINSITIHWPNAQYSAQWSAKEKRWLLWHNGKPNLDDAGMQLGTPTLVIQNVVITPSIYGDKFGGVTPLSQSIGTGSGYLLRDGKVFPLTWSRPSAESGTEWASNGKPANFAAGGIWFMLTDRAPTIEYSVTPSPSASPEKSK